jgi:hypothetical protein
MSKTYYELLEVAPAATVDEIKRAFRREIARYHPDKVHHLGKEFQDIAAVKAAELTEAYKVLTDQTLRADYDALLAGGAATDDAPPPPAAPPAAPQPAPAARPATEPSPASRPAAEPPRSAPSSVFQEERAGARDLVLKAAIARFRAVLEGEFGRFEAPQLAGFQVTCVPKPSFFSMKFPPRVFGRVVPMVDAAAVAEAWSLAAKTPKDKQRDLCVFLMGPAVAQPAELAIAISEERRRPMLAGGKLFLIPMNTRTWAAHVPADAPPVVKSLLTRLKSA